MEGGALVCSTDTLAMPTLQDDLMGNTLMALDPAFSSYRSATVSGAMEAPDPSPLRGAVGTTSPYPDLAAIDEAAAILAAAERPLIIAQSSGVDQESVPAMAALLAMARRIAVASGRALSPNLRIASICSAGSDFRAASLRNS